MTEETKVPVEEKKADPASVQAPPPKPKGPGILRRAGHKCLHVVKFIVLLPLFWWRTRRAQDSMNLYAVHTGFFFWAVIALGVVLSTTVRLAPDTAVGCGWTYVWCMFVFMLSLIYDLNVRKLALLGVIFFAIWMGLTYAQEVKHWVVLGAITQHLASLKPSLDPGLASALAWLAVIPFVHSVAEMFLYGRKRITPNEVCEYHFMERDELMDRLGIRFCTHYRDLLETFLSFGGGDIVAMDNHGLEFKRYRNVLFLWFIWPRLERIIEQRAVVEDNGPPADKVETAA